MIAQLYERIGLDWKLRQTERSHSVTLKTSRLPLEPFRYYQYGERTVHLDGCVEVEAAYYSAPPLWIGRRVKVQWNLQWVRLLDPQTGQLLREPRGRHRIHQDDRPQRTLLGTLQLPTNRIQPVTVR